ncbi:hypothetical protein HYH03_016067 [Edaphochlamys debaryana]|uniref:Guanylate cyclase domain-containing protein n=1 Tax=Edaphochlamys debaryana TaxID=47281 RepID=A0A835XJD3_9CHLO|nr:hypothetical protein HYH03_016067 [Edaphochlamys debaryana]|eukprot:KAG2485178.1 hypothetical protein HYH03_016067 [Edaphochlamys debaryana]
MSLLDGSIASLEQAAQLAPAGAATSDGWAVAAEGVEAPWSSKAAGFPTTGALAQAVAGAQPVSSWPTVLDWDAQALGLGEYAALPLLRAHASSPNSSWLRQLESDAAAGSGLPPQLLAPRPGQAGGAAPAPLLLLYRRDWLERLAAGDGVSGRRRSTAETRGASDLLPPTWDMLAQLLGSLVNRDLDGDGRPDHALCVNLLPDCKGGALLTAIWASLAQSGGTAQGLWFNSADMSPALDGPALPEALRLYAALAASNAAPFTPGGQALSRSTLPVTPEDLLAAGGALDPTSGAPLCGAINPLFAAGRCLFTIDWAPSAPRLAYQNVSGVLGAALLPGSLFVSSTSAARSTTMEGPKGPPRAAPPPSPPEPQQLLPCNPTRCPHAEPLADTAALADAWGRYGVDFRGTGVGQAQQEGGEELWVNRAPLLGEAGDVWVLAPGQSPATAMRTAEFIRQALSDATATLEMAPADVTALAQALAASAAHPNAAMDVLLPYSSSYRAALDELASGSLLATAAGNRSTDLQRLLAATRAKFVTALQALPYPAITKTLYHHSIGLHTAATSGPEDVSSDRAWAVGVAVGVSVGGTVLLVLAGLFLLWRLRLRPRAPLLSRGVKPPGPGPATTLALTDVQNSTLLWEVLSAELMDECMAIHHGVMRMGDAFAVAFHDPEDALAFAMDIQAALLVADWPPELLAHTDGCEPRRRRSTTGAQLQAPPPSLLQLHPSLQAPGQPFSAATTASHHFASHSQTDSQLLAGTLGTGAVDSVAMASYSVGGASNSSGGGWYGRPRLLSAPQGAAPPGAASPAGRPPSIPISAAWRAARQPGVAAPALLSPIQSGQQWQTTSRAQAGLAAGAAASEHAAVQGTTVAAGVDARPESGQAGAAAAPDDELLARPRPVSLRKHSSWSAGSISVAAASALHNTLGNEDPASARNSSSGGQGQDLLGAAEAGLARAEALDGVSAAEARWADGEPEAEPLSSGAHGLDPGRWDPRLVVPAEDETCVSEGIISAASIREQLLGAAPSPGGDRGGGGGPVAAEGPPSAGTGASMGLREVSSAGVPALSSPFRFEGSNPSDSVPGLGPGSDDPMPKPEPKPQPRLQKQRAPAPHPSMPPPSASQQPLHGRSGKAPKVADAAAGQGGPEAALFGPMDHLMDDGLGKFLEWRAHVNWFDEEVVTAAFRHDVYRDGPAGGAGRRNRRQLPGQQRGDEASGPRPKGEPQQPRERPSQPRRLTLDLPRRRTLDGHDGLGPAPAGAAGRGLPRASSHGHGSSQAAVGQRAAQQQQQRPVLRGALSWARRGVSSLLSGSLGTPEATTSAEASDPADAKVAPAAGADPSARLRRQGDSTGNATTSAPLPVMQDGSRRPRQDVEQSPQGSARPLAADKLAAAGSGLLSRISHATLQLLPIKARRNSRTPAAGSSAEAVPAVEIAAGSPPSASGSALSPGLIFLRKSTEGDGVHSGQARDGPTSGDQDAAAEPAPLISTTPAQDRDGRPSDPGAPAVSNTLTSNRQSLLRSIEVSASAWARTPSGAQEQASPPAPSPADLTLPDTVSLGTVGMEAWRQDVTTVVPGGKLPSGVLSGTLSGYYKQQTQVSLQPMVTSASTQLSRKVISLMQHTGGAGILPQPSAPAGSSTADLFRDLNAAALLLASEQSQATAGNQGSGTIAAQASSPQDEPVRRGPALWLHSAGATVAAAFKLLYERLTVEDVAEVRAQLKAADIGARAFAGPGSGDPELVLRGLRIRVGLHSGPREGEVELAVVDRVEVARYKGDFLATAKEVSDAAVGGMVVLGGATFRAFQQLGRQRGRGRSDLSFLHLGEHQVKPPPDLDSTLVGLAQTQELSALFSSATSAHELFLAMCPGLLPRLALLPSPVRTHRETVPGFLSAPAGEVAPVFCNVLGVEALLSWEKVLQERSRMLRTQSNNLALSGRASLLGAFPSGSILGGRPPGDTLSEAGDSHGGLPGGGRRRARSGPVHAALGILRDSVVEAATRHGGYVVASSSDGGHWVLVFPAPEAAVQWGLEMLQVMLTADWPAGFLEHELTEEQWSDGVLVRRGLRLHIGIDYGRAMVRLVPRTGRLDYVGRPMNRAARIAAKAKAATVLVSDTVWNSVRPSMGPAVRGRSLGQVQLKGVREPLELWALQGAA